MRLRYYYRKTNNIYKFYIQYLQIRNNSKSLKENDVITIDFLCMHDLNISVQEISCLMKDLFTITERFDTRKCYLSAWKNPESTAKTDMKAILSNLNHIYNRESEDPVSNNFEGSHKDQKERRQSAHLSLGLSSVNELI